MDGSTMECFMCLKDIGIYYGISDNGSVEEENDVHIKCEDGFRADNDYRKVSLRYICHYLNINLNEMSKSDNISRVTDADEQGVDNFLVKLCMDCTSVVSRLSNLCEELEVLQMKVNYSLQNLNNVMQRKTPGLDADTATAGNGAFDNNDEVWDGNDNGLTALRSEIKRKCEQNLKRMQPTVRIGRVSGNVLGKLHKTIRIRETFLPSDSTSTSSSSDEDNNGNDGDATDFNSDFVNGQISFEIKQEPLEPSDNNSDTEATETPSMPSSMVRTSLSKGSKTGRVRSNSKKNSKRTNQSLVKQQYTCPICKRECKTKLGFALHKRSCRLEDANIQKICLKFTNMVYETTTDSFICTICGPNCKIRNDIYRVNRHQITNHLEEVFKTCNEANLSQTDFKVYCQHVFKVELLSSECLYNETDGRSYCKCAHCFEKLANQDTLGMHLITHHKEILDQKLVELQRTVTTAEEVGNLDLAELEQARRWKCFDCGATFKQERNLRRHKKASCRYGLKTDGNEGRDFKCPVCKKILKRKDGFLRHKAKCVQKRNAIDNSHEESSCSQATKTHDEVNKFLDAEEEVSNSSDQFSSCVTVKTEEASVIEDEEVDEYENTFQSMDVDD